MNIVFISTYPPAYCGIGTYTAALTRELRAQGHQVTILAEHYGGVPEDPQAFNLWDRRSGYESPMGLGRVAHALTHGQGKPDVVHIQHEFGLFPRNQDLRMLIDEVKIPFVITLHTVPKLPKRLTELVPIDSEIIVHTPAGAAEMAKRGRCVDIIPHGVEIVEVPGDHPKQHILVPGFVSPNKGLEEILEAWALTDCFRRYKLLIAGLCRDHHYEQIIRDKIQNLGIAGTVAFSNQFATEANYHANLHDALAVVLGADKDTPYSASGQLHTALGYGLPIVAKNVPIYHAPGGILRYHSATECSRWLDALALDDALCATLRTHSEYAAQSRTWAKVAAQHVALYQKAGTIRD
jgi:glycosyltransferase involved in cell wall biosynthesis